jgi:hypothetical protein
MKSEERHKLKTNELADSLSKLPDYLQKHGKNLLMGAIVVVAALVAGSLWWRMHKTEQQQRETMLAGLMLQGEQDRMSAIMRSMDPKTGESYNPVRVAASLGDLAANSDPSRLSMEALLQQAETLRSELLFSDQPMTEEQKKSICQKVESIYEKVLKEYPNDSVGQGGARMGLALLAEDRQDWAKAKSLYEQIIAEADTRFAGTQFPAQARDRLKLMDTINQPIEFAMATEPPPSPPAELGAPVPAAPASGASAPAAPESAAPAPAPAATQPATPPASQPK